LISSVPGGPMILGHAHPSVIAAIQAAAVDGTSFGAPTPTEVDLASMVVEAVPSIEKVRFVNSGTEATMSAVRLARGYTGRNIVIKFDGCYHGHADSFLVKAGSGLLTLGIPGSPGVPDDIVKNTLSVPYNNLESLENTLKRKAVGDRLRHRRTGSPAIWGASPRLPDSSKVSVS